MLVKVRIDDKMIETSVGRVFLNQVIPKELGYQNKNFDKKTISQTIDKYFRIAGNERTCHFLDAIKELGSVIVGKPADDSGKVTGPRRRKVLSAPR